MKVPTTLIELTVRDYRRMKDNCIYVSGISRVKRKKKAQGETLYSEVIYACNISVSRNKIDIGLNEWYQHITIGKTTKKLS